MTTSPSPIPPHLSVAVFRDYEQHIFAITKNFPNPTTFDPKPLSPVTFAARLRDAMRSHRIYKWQSVVDPAALEEVRGKLIIVPEGNLVFARLRLAERQTVGELIEMVEPKTEVTKVLNPHENDLWCVAWLISRRIIKGPFVFEGADHAWAEKLKKANYNVGISVEGNITTLL